MIPCGLDISFLPILENVFHADYQSVDIFFFLKMFIDTTFEIAIIAASRYSLYMFFKNYKFTLKFVLII